MAANGKSPYGNLWNGDPIELRRRQLAINEMNPWWGSRSELFRGFDDPRRDIDYECGYPDTTAWSADNYYDLFEREPIATRVVQLMPKECWQTAPIIKDIKTKPKDTAYELAVRSLDVDLRGGWHVQKEGSVVNEMLYRADELSGIGSFGILLLGFDDGRSLDQPVDGMMDVTGQTMAMDTRTKKTITLDEMAKDTTKNARYIATRKLSYRNLLPDSPLHPKEQEAILKPASRRQHDGWHPAKFPDGKPNPEGGKEKYKDTSPLPLTGNEQWLLMRWEEERKAVINSAAEKLATHNLSPKTNQWRSSDSNLPMTLTSNEVAVIREGLVTTDMVTNARKPQGKLVDPLWSDGVSAPVQTDAANNPQGAGYGSGFDATGFQQENSPNIPGVETLVPDTRGMDVGSIGGTESQYYGVQMGPSEMPVGGTERSEGKQRRLLFIRAYAENLVQVVRYEWNSRNPRFGMPVMYRVTLNDPREVHSGVGLPLATVFVHWTRVIHIADNLTSSEIFGVPRMRPVLNPILDCKKVRASAAEAYWKNCVMKISFETHPQLGGDVNVNIDEMQNMVEQADNSLQPFWLTSGLTAKPISPALADPTSTYDMLQQTICTQLGVPLRIWQGAERGQLASTQDDDNWNDRCTHRCNSYITPRIICPFYDRLIAVGVLPAPEEGYSVEWPDRESLGDMDRATIAQQITGSLQQFITGDLESVMTLKDFLTKVHNFTEDEADEIIENSQKANEEGGYDVDLNTLRSSGGPTAMVDLFEKLKAGTLSESAFKHILMLFYDMDEDKAQLIADDVREDQTKEDDEENILDDPEAAAVALQKTQAMAAYLAGGVDALIDRPDYLAEFMGIDIEVAKEMIARAEEAKKKLDEEAAANAPQDPGFPITDKLPIPPQKKPFPPKPGVPIKPSLPPKPVKPSTNPSPIKPQSPSVGVSGSTPSIASSTAPSTVRNKQESIWRRLGKLLGVLKDKPPTNDVLKSRSWGE